MISCRQLPIESWSGAVHMAADELLLHAAERGVASLRFYTWSEPTLSLGYFQKSADRLPDIAWVRRPSGGGAILHHHELTYCLALPAGAPWQTRESWVCRFHHLVGRVFQSFDIAVRGVVCGEEKKLGEFLCFQHQTPADLLIGSAKIVGSAQRKLHGAIMQHGSILLGRSRYASELPGVAELTGSSISPEQLAEDLTREFHHDTGWELRPEPFTSNEVSAISRLAEEKYASAAWNEKR